MTSAIVMAGYNNKWAVSRYAKIVAEHYGEKFIESGYKPLREFTTRVNGKAVRKPLVEFTLDKLLDCERVEDIVLVGHQMLLEQRLGRYIRRSGKPCTIINQNAGLSSEIITQFRIQPRKVKYNSIAGNMIKGYMASTASKTQAHALFVASDSPLTSLNFINYFSHLADPLIQNYNIICPAVAMEGQTDGLGRNPLRLVNDSGYDVRGHLDQHGRMGFRLSSVLIANPNHFDINTANTAYNLRKCLNPKVQIKLFKITRSHGYPNVYSKYFLRRDMTVSEVEKFASDFFHGRVKIIPVNGEETTYDYDGTEHEYLFLNNILNDPD